MRGELDTLLWVLSSSTRRRIVRLLVRRPAYLLEMNKKLGISQQALLKHLKEMERRGIVETFNEKSSYNAPPRKYYKLRDDLTWIYTFFMDDEFINLLLGGEGMDPGSMNDLMSRISDMMEEMSGENIDVIIKEVCRLLSSLLRMRERMTNS